jgi:protein TonB
MDNQTHKSEDAWVDGKLATLLPSADWHPDSKPAYAKFLKRRDSGEPEASPSWVRLSMTVGILASIGLVVTLLPWHALWNPAAKNDRLHAEPVKAATPVVPDPEPQLASTPAPPQPEQPQPALSHVVRPESSDEARRAHILGTASLQTPGPGTGAEIAQTAVAAQEPGPKPAEHVENGVTAPRPIPPMPQPDYTDEARQAHVQGNVVIDVIVRTDGTGKVNKVIQGLGYGLDEKATEAFEKWRFQPGTKDGMPVDVELQITIGFHLL